MAKFSQPVADYLMRRMFAADYTSDEQIIESNLILMLHYGTSPSTTDPADTIDAIADGQYDADNLNGSILDPHIVHITTYNNNGISVDLDVQQNMELTQAALVSGTHPFNVVSLYTVNATLGNVQIPILADYSRNVGQPYNPQLYSTAFTFPGDTISFSNYAPNDGRLNIEFDSAITQLSYYSKVEFIKMIMNESTYTQPTNYYIGLVDKYATTGQLYNNAVADYEPNNGSYARQVINLEIDLDDPLGLTYTNSNTIEFPDATAVYSNDFLDLTYPAQNHVSRYYAVFDAPTGGNLMFWGLIDDLSHAVGTNVTIPPNTVTIEFIQDTPVLT